MNELNVFVSVGSNANERQEAFVRAVEDRLRSEGIIPHTVGRNTFSADAPLKTSTQLMDRCIGTVVIAFERIYFKSGVERRGAPKEKALADIKLATPWNQIEAAMAYTRGLPLLVIVENGIRSEGLLERGFDWHVQSVTLDSAALTSAEFNGVLADWKQKMMVGLPKKAPPPNGLADLTVGELIKGLKPTQLWSILGALAVLVAGSFTLGAKLFGR
jgi:hypothetical protein